MLESTRSRSCFSHLKLFTAALSEITVSGNFCSINSHLPGSSEVRIAPFRMPEWWTIFLESIFASVLLANEIKLVSSVPISFRISNIELDANDTHHTCRSGQLRCNSHKIFCTCYFTTIQFVIHVISIWHVYNKKRRYRPNMTSWNILDSNIENVKMPENTMENTSHMLGVNNHNKDNGFQTGQKNNTTPDKFDGFWN